MTKLSRNPIGLATLIALLAAANVRAGILYSAPPDYTQSSFLSTSTSGDEQESSPFMLTNTSTIAGINFWGNYFFSSNLSDSFTVAFYTGSTGPDPTAIATSSTASLTRTDLGFTGVRGDEEYSYMATLSTPFAATGGTQYYVAILNANSTWDWQLDGSGSNYYRLGGDGNAWILSDFPQQDAFQLVGPAAVSAPEPSSLAIALVLSGFTLAGLWWRNGWRSLATALT